MGYLCGPDGSGSVPWAWHSSQSQVSRLFQAEVVTGCSAAGLRSFVPFLVAQLLDLPWLAYPLR